MRFIKKNYRMLCGIFLLVIFFCWNGFLNSSAKKAPAKADSGASITADTQTADANEVKAQDISEGFSLTASSTGINTDATEASDDIVSEQDLDLTASSTDDISALPAEDDVTEDPNPAEDINSTPEGDLVEPMGPLDSYDPNAADALEQTENSDSETPDETSADASDTANAGEDTTSSTTDEQGTETTPEADETPAEQGYVHIETAKENRPSFNFCIADVSNSLNVRQGPSTGYALAGKMHSNSCATVLEYGDEWSKVTSNGIVGYAYNAYLLTGDSALNRIRNLGALYIKVFTNVLNVRTEPNTDCRIIKRLTDGDKYPYIPEYSNREWFAIRLEDEQIGYVSTAYCSIYIDLPGITAN